jgi:nicotinate-nucleotide adenylyltransferase
MRRLGILGGTFDPIHCGHVDAAAAAQSALGLAGVLIVPSHTPPHRPEPQASSYHRFAMAALAVAGRDGWRASDLELLREPPSYTADTLVRLHDEGFAPDALVFVLGADAFADIETWRGFPGVLDLAHFAVVSRPGTPAAGLARRLPALADRMTRRLAPGASPSIVLLEAPTADVSSTAIRRLRAEGRSIAGLVPPSVAQHIEQHGLYAASAAAPDVGAPFHDRAADGLHRED